MRRTDAKTRIRLYRMMHLVRRTEEILMAEYHPANEMRCPMHFCVGQEAMPAALACVMRRDDVLMSHYRSHGYYLAKEAPLVAMIAEFYGKSTGANGGVAGSMELASHEYNFYSGAIVAGSLFIPLGSAFAQKYRGVDDISISVIGDGALDEGIAYEVFNLAALHNLPLLIICENNGYAAHTSIEKRMAVPLLAERAKAFGVPATKLDGNDPEVLLQYLEATIPSIRGGGGPRFVEIATYRQCAHVGPQDDDSMGYRTAEEMAHWKGLDPVPRLRRILIEALGLKEIEDLEAETEAEVAAAIAAAKRAEFPDFAATIAMNFAGTYGPAVHQFVENSNGTFDGGQPEARLGPF